MRAPALPASLLSRVEDAGLNASAPPQQRWVDGWLVRFSPGKAKRSRCINAVAEGRLDLDERIAVCRAIYDAAGLPTVVRITPFTQPPGLDDWLERRGWTMFDDTRVMVAPRWPEPSGPIGRPWLMHRVTHAEFANAVGELRGSPPAQRHAHAERLASSPVPFEGWVVRPRGSERVAACGQFAVEAGMVGLYDVFTHPEHRGLGLATRLCSALLEQAAKLGARVAYLQVDAGNLAARSIYRQLGFDDAYRYHYRALDADPD